MHVFLFSLFKSVRLFLISVACITLAACGGGGGGSSDSPTPVITPEPTPTPTPTPMPVPVPSDTSPDAFTLNVESDAELNDEFTASVTVSGIDTETAITINGTGGEYKIDDGDYTIATGAVVNGQTVTVKATAADTYATLREITLTIGDQSDVFSVTTRDAVVIPADFEFTETPSAEPGSDNTSNSITVAGIEIPVAISITGGEYKIDEGDYTAEEGTVSADQVVTVRVTAADDFATDATASLTIGDKTADYVVTTKVADQTPDAFVLNFPGLGEDITAELDTEYTSSEITISGVEVDVPVSITNGLYQINGEGDFISTVGTVSDGDTIIVKAVSSSTVNTSITVSLSVGSELSPVNSVFNITTLDDINDPEVTILFPPALSLTDGPEVYIRGTATDDLSGIQSLMINGVPAEDTSEDGSFSTWQVTIPLTENQQNTLIVEAEDNASNMGFANILVTQDSVGINFPNDENPFYDEFYARMVWDEARNTIWVAHAINGDVFGVNVLTGNRTPLNVTSVEGLTNARGDSILLAPDGDYLWMGDTNTGDIYEIDLIDSEGSMAGTRRVKWYGAAEEGDGVDIINANGLTLPLPNPKDNTELLVTDDRAIVTLNMETNSRQYFSSNNISDSENNFERLSTYLIRDPNNECWLVPDSGVSSVFCVYDDGTREIISNDTIPNSDGPSIGLIFGAALDVDRNSLLLSNPENNEIYSVQLSNANRGERSVFSNNTTPNSYNNTLGFFDVVKLGGLDYLLTMDFGNYQMIAVDLETGNRVVVSRGVPAD